MKLIKLLLKMRRAIVISLLAWIGVLSASKAQTIYDVTRPFKNYDMNGDGIVEIIDLAPYMGTGQDFILPYGKVVTILLEERLIHQTIANNQFPEFDLSLRTFMEDLKHEGYIPNILTVKLHTGPGQDGRTVLAIREFFKSVKSKYPNFQGAMLVGAFPSASINNKAIWKMGEKLSIDPGSVRGLYGDRGDIILGDLNGNWANLYRQTQTIEALDVQFSQAPLEGATAVGTLLRRQSYTHRDFFFIDDSNYMTASISPPSIGLRVSYNRLHPELAAEDRLQSNPIARPEISISRINARDIAYNSAGVRDSRLEIQLLVEYFDRNHKHRIGGTNPTAYRGAAIGHSFGSGWILNHFSNSNPSFSAGFFKDDASLAEYKDWFKKPAILRGIMAHANAVGTDFTGGSATANFHKTIWEEKALKDAGSHFVIHGGCFVNSPVSPNETSFMTHGLGQNSESILFYMNSLAVMSRAKEFNDYIPNGFTETFAGNSNATFGDGWKQYFTSMGAAAYNTNDPYQFKRSYFWGVQGDWSLRLRYEKGMATLGLGVNGLQDEAMVPNNSYIQDNNYLFKNTDRILGKGNIDGSGGDNFILQDPNSWISIVKVNYYNEMKNSILGYSFTTADGFDLTNAKLKEVGDYNGDGIDDMLMVNGTSMAILTYKAKKWTVLISLRNDDWVGGWRYNVANTIHGTGDFDNDGRKDILISSPWGIGIIKYNGSQFTTQLALPNGSQFGQWNYNSITQTFKGIADINGDKKSDIILTSGNSGLGILSLNSTNSSFTSLSVNKNLENIGTWKLNTLWPDWDTYPDNFVTFADFDGDGGLELVVVNMKQGLGILTFKNGVLTTLVKASDDSWFGGWRFGVANQIVGAKDMNNDRKAELIMRSPWGIGVLNYTQNWFGSLSVNPYGSMLGNWYLESTDEIASIGQFGRIGNKLLLKKKNPSSVREEFYEEQVISFPKNETLGSEVIAYPMPFSGTFKLKSGSFIGKEISVEIINIEGKLIHKIMNYQAESEIDLGSNLPNGTYILKIISSTKTDILKIIKM